MRHTATQAIGIVTLLVGASSSLEYSNPLVPLVSVICGLTVGELLGIEERLGRFDYRLEKRFSRGETPVSRAFITTSLLFCVGPLTVIGSLEDGLKGDYSLLASRAPSTLSRRSPSPRFWGGASCSLCGDGARGAGLADAGG